VGLKYLLYKLPVNLFLPEILPYRKKAIDYQTRCEGFA